MREERISRSQPRPYRKGWCPSAPQLWEFPFIYSYTLCRRTTKFDVVTHMGRDVYLGVSHTYHPKRVEFQRNPILGVLLYLCLHPLTHNDQIWHCNTYGEGRVLGGQPFAQMRRAVCQLQLSFLFCWRHVVDKPTVTF